LSKFEFNQAKLFELGWIEILTRKWEFTSISKNNISL